MAWHGVAGGLTGGLTGEAGLHASLGGLTGEAGRGGRGRLTG